MFKLNKYQTIVFKFYVKMGRPMNEIRKLVNGFKSERLKCLK